jgi:hypothetical protein
VPGRPVPLDRAPDSRHVVLLRPSNDGGGRRHVQGTLPDVATYFRSFTVGSVVVVVGGAGSAVTLLPVPLM